MNDEQRIQKLEQSVRRLTLITVGAVSFGAGAVLMGFGSGQPAVSSDVRQAVAVPSGGFAVVPGSRMDWTVIR